MTVQCQLIDFCIYVWYSENLLHSVLFSETWLWWSCDQWNSSWLADIQTAILGNTYTHSALQEIWGDYWLVFTHISVCYY